MVAVGGAVAAALAIADPLKPEARGVVAALAQRGLAVHLVTGDNWCALRQQGLGHVIKAQGSGYPYGIRARAARPGRAPGHRRQLVRASQAGSRVPA